MSLYRQGLGLPAPQEQLVHTGFAEKKPGPGLGVTLAFVAGVTGLIYFGVPAIRRARMPKATARRPDGPDVSDIEARIRARGLNPKQYF